MINGWGPGGRPSETRSRDAGQQPLPDYGGVDVDELAERTAHPVLGAVLAGLRGRARLAGEAVAYHEDSPSV
ncbi:YxD-tail cyclophane-containing RiPP peptide [Streptomyces sp. NPDC020096]